jgi:nucleoside-diphosphate-sugar epimerase
VNVCITGATGFLGRRLVRALVEDGLNVRCLLRETSDPAPLLEAIPTEQHPRIEIVRGSLSDSRFLFDQLDGIDAIYHLAAALTGDCGTMERETIEPTRRLIEAALERTVGRFVLVSSIGVYGTGELSPGSLLDELAPLEPHPEWRDPYTFSKVLQEQAAWEAYETSGLPLVVVRPGVIYGPGRSPLSSRMGLAFGPLLLHPVGKHPLPYTYVENCAEAIKQAGIVPGVEGEAFNVVDDQLPTTRTILRTLNAHGRRVCAVPVPTAALGTLGSLYAACTGSAGRSRSRVRYSHRALWKPMRYCNAKARHRLNWEPGISTEEALERTIAG